MAAATTRSRLRQYLNDVDYPADKDTLLEVANRNGCDEDTSRALRAIPPETYANFGEVLSSVALTDDQDLTDSAKAEAHRVHTKPNLAQSAKDVGPVNPIVEELGENRGS
ncbi:MAG TPA: DUF2795 domain-containing protein [Mycobacterium sp.]|jgi:hypothetical protein|nr:DUF2795 domain-containing protein [Mycobacterium sp.]